MSWSKEQLAAIETRGKNILVAAAAGSGKTSVLVERIISRILDEKNPFDVDKLLVVTFTNAAAVEMRTRIGAALSETLKDNPGLKQVERQLVLLNSAAICTIHAFCQNIIKQNFHILDLDPQFRIAGEAETLLLKNDVLENLFEAKYSEGDQLFLDLVEHYGSEQSDDELYKLILGLYEFSRSHPYPSLWLEGLQDSFDLAAAAEIDQTPWSKLLREKMILELQSMQSHLDRLNVEAASSLPEYVDTLASDKVVLDEIIEGAEKSWQQTAFAIDTCQFVKMKAAPKGTPDDLKKYFQNGRQKVKNKVNEFKEHFFDRPAEELLTDMRLVAPLVKTLGQLVIKFGEEFAKVKRAKGVVDFSDLEHFCLQILLDNTAPKGVIKPSAVACSLQEKYTEIMVDEYQDTNGVQETIIKLVASSNMPNLFLVGDVKQSIYRFRLAEPALFMQKYRSYPTAGKDYTRIDLANNFRSRASVLHAVNFLFTQLMSPAVSELEYGEAEQLNPGPDYPQGEGLVLDSPVELCIIDRDKQADDEEQQESQGESAELSEQEELSAFELEARLIAQRLEQLMTSGYKVYDKNSKDYRDLCWRDIVILLRSVKGKATVLLDVFRQRGIPAYAEVDAGYFREIEVQVMLALLSIIDNPRQDIALAGVLRSPVAGFSPIDLAKIRMQKSGELWNGLVAAGNNESGELEQHLVNKVQQFLIQLKKWRNMARCKSVPELIWQIYRDTGYYDYVGGMPGGMLRQANLRALYDRARQYEATNFRGLFRFLRFLERMQDKGSDLAVARTLGESEDVVRIMSIHKSKGLEFPVVFIADLGKNINLQDSKATVLCHKELGVGPYVTDAELRFRYPTLARYGIAHKLTMETKAEELRILYVALTRAREKLILVGSAAKLAKKAAGWCQVTDRVKKTLPDWLIAGAKSYLDWICPCIARHVGGENLRQYVQCTSSISKIFAEDESKWQVSIYQPTELAQMLEEEAGQATLLDNVSKLEQVEDSTNFSLVDSILSWQYGYANIVSKPAKLSVTEIKRRFDSQTAENGQVLYKKSSITLRPRFIQQSGKLTGAELGTLLHSIMQHVDLDGKLDEQGIKEQLDGMVIREIILPEQLEYIDIQKVAGFFTSKLGKRLCASNKVRRELPFSLMLPAESFYDDIKGSGEGIFIQGVIDVLFDESDGLVLLDYKSDYTTNSADLADKYSLQLKLYAKAVEHILKQPVKEKYLYVFSTGESVKI